MFFFSSRRRHTRLQGDWSSDVCSSDLFEELWNYGTPQELTHFAHCVRGKETPQATGEDGLVVLRAIYAAYASAGEGRKIALPYQPPPEVKKPIDLWLNGAARQQTAPH